MKKHLLTFSVFIFLAFLASAADTQNFEYATIRWDGDNTYVVLPSGKVDFVGKQLKALPVPERVDQRTYYLNVTMNSLGGKGYKFAGMSGDGNIIVMKREIAASSDSK